jgi:hypothetical protein
MARAAYAVACRKHPESFVVLAIKAQILKRSWPECGQAAGGQSTSAATAAPVRSCYTDAAVRMSAAG